MTMRIYLDDQECPITTDSVAEAVSQAAAMAEQAGRMIIDVTIDGENLSEERLGELESINGHADEVKLTSANPHELVSQTLGDAAAALEEADRLQQNAAEMIQSDKYVDGLQDLQSAFEIWTAVHDAVVKGTALLNIRLDAISFESDDALVRVERLAEELRVVRDALTNQDPVALSDALLYQLPEVICQWRELLSELQDHIRTISSTDAQG